MSPETQQEVPLSVSADLSDPEKPKVRVEGLNDGHVVEKAFFIAGDSGGEGEIFLFIRPEVPPQDASVTNLQGLSCSYGYGTNLSTVSHRSLLVQSGTSGHQKLTLTSFRLDKGVIARLWEKDSEPPVILVEGTEAEQSPRWELRRCEIEIV